MTKIFYYDIFLINNELIDEWKKDFFWPVSPKKTQQILNKILEINFKFLEKEKNLFFRNCFLTYNHTWNPYITYLITCYLKKN